MNVLVVHCIYCTYLPMNLLTAGKAVFNVPAYLHLGHYVTIYIHASIIIIS